MTSRQPDYHGYRFPSEIISHAVCLYHRFCFSFREVVDLLAERGVTVSYESIRQWCLQFGPEYARRLRQRERHMRRFKSAGQAQRFLTTHGAVQNLFRIGRHLIRGSHARLFRARAFVEWQQVTCAR